MFGYAQLKFPTKVENKLRIYLKGRGEWEWGLRNKQSQTKHCLLTDVWNDYGQKDQSTD